jgi:hypothetical protein
VVHDGDAAGEPQEVGGAVQVEVGVHRHPALGQPALGLGAAVEHLFQLGVGRRPDEGRPGVSPTDVHRLDAGQLVAQRAGAGATDLGRADAPLERARAVGRVVPDGAGELAGQLGPPVPLLGDLLGGRRHHEVGGADDLAGGGVDGADEPGGLERGVVDRAVVEGERLDLGHDFTRDICRQ